GTTGDAIRSSPAGIPHRAGLASRPGRSLVRARDRQDRRVRVPLPAPRSSLRRPASLPRLLSAASLRQLSRAGPFPSPPRPRTTCASGSSSEKSNPLQRAYKPNSVRLRPPKRPRGAEADFGGTIIPLGPALLAG